MKQEPFDIGDEIILYADLTNAAGAAADPTDLQLTVETPAGAQTVTPKAGLQNPTVGRWEKTVLITASGLWKWKWKTLGGFLVTAEGTTAVRESQID